jgi:hypothetical protein
MDLSFFFFLGLTPWILGRRVGSDSASALPRMMRRRSLGRWDVADVNPG